jgi:glycosyltransferase involved in cell wall biosynthesis
MRIICLSKRRPQGRDLVERSYGRFYHLPQMLAARGHDVVLALLDYAREGDLDFERDGMRWMVRSLGRAGPARYARAVHELARQPNADWLIGFSDIYFGLLAERIARACDTASLIDAYDNYESYIPWLKPLHWLWRRALRRATLVSAAGPDLARLMSRERTREALILPMAADPQFTPIPDRDRARRALKLPLESRLIGFCGGLHPNRGLSVLFEAVAALRRRDENVRLVLSGRLFRGVRLPDDAIWLGYLADEMVPDLIASLDLLAVVNRASAFGLHSHPVKLYEAMRCQTPVVATATPATRWILQGHPNFLARAGDAGDLARALQAGLEHDRYDFQMQGGWGGVAADLDQALSAARLRAREATLDANSP